MERKKRKKHQRRRGRAKSQQIPAARGQSQIRHRSPEKSPEICRHADGHNRRCQCHRKSDPRQNEWQGDGNEPAADAIGENEKKENEWTGGIEIANEKSWPQYNSDEMQITRLLLVR